MKRSKHQAPRSREDPSSKDPTSEDPRLREDPLASSWVDGSGFEPMMLKDGPIKAPEGRHPFDLLERTAVFGENIVRFSRKIPRDPTNNRLIEQLVGARSEERRVGKECR